MSLVGLGKLGCCLGACFADSGLDVVGVDVEEKVVKCINEGRAPFAEPGLDEMLARVGGKKLRATLAHKDAIEQTDITFILTATPSNSDGSFSNRYVETAVISLGTALFASPKPYHIFVISSTVIPGSIENSFIPLIEKYSDRKLNEGFGVCYDPDWVALGSVLRDFKNPDFVLIGESNPQDGEFLAAMHHRMCENNPPVSRMSLISGEIAKVSLNAYITMKISFANMLANLCENIPGADVDAITSTIGRDRRISPHYFKGGLAFGGNCFPRDTRAFRAFAKSQGNPADIIVACDRVNDHQDKHLVQKVLKLLESVEPKTVGILGLAFKPKTYVTTESPAIKLIRELIKHNVHIIAYDPLATDNAKILFGDQVQYVSSAEQCLNLSSLWVLTQPAPEFKVAVENCANGRPVTVLDCWRILEPKKLTPQVHYVPMGRVPAELPEIASAMQPTAIAA